jgi:ATP-binding cassette, subfamily B, bacterial IrtA/YbtP
LHNNNTSNFTYAYKNDISERKCNGGCRCIAKSTIANLISRFFDVSEGQVLVGGVDVRNIKKETLMYNVSFVFQNSRLIKGTILENVRMSRPKASREKVIKALQALQCMDIIKNFRTKLIR